MRNEIKILSNGVNCDTRNIADVLCFAAERAEFVCRGILEHLCSCQEPERSAMALEADRNLAAIEVLRKDKVCRGLLPDWFCKAVGDAFDELKEGLREYVKRFPEDKAARLLTSGAAPTLRGYLQTALEDYHE